MRLQCPRLHRWSALEPLSRINGGPLCSYKCGIKLPPPLWIILTKCPSKFGSADLAEFGYCLPPVSKMCPDDVRVFATSKHLVGEWQQTEHCRVQFIGPIAEHVQPKLQSFAVVTLIVSKLHQRHNLRQSIIVPVALFTSFALHNQLQYPPQAACTHQDNEASLSTLACHSVRRHSKRRSRVRRRSIKV